MSDRERPREDLPDAETLGAEIFAHVDALAALTETPDALTRTYLSERHREANALVAGWMQAAGMSARTDAAGNVVGRYEGRRPELPALLFGSHLDTVRDAGRYDGMLGVVLPIACVAELNRRNERFDFAIEVVGFGDEEGVRFQSTLLGSRALAGSFDPALLDARDAGGVRLADAMRTFGLDPDRIGDAARRGTELLGYCEVHIEQGPVLEAEDLPVGVVSAIAGATRLRITLGGEAGHAGTVPMALRRDALAAAAELVLAVERICSAGPDLVGTVGRIDARPGAVNVIPGEVELSVDLRSGDDARRAAALAELTGAIDAIAARRGVTARVERSHDNAACACAPWLMQQIGNAIAAEGVAVRELPSGAGHDAMAIASLCDVGMLFVRCERGVSHNPAEAMALADAGIAARVVLRLLRAFGPPAERARLA